MEDKKLKEITGNLVIYTLNCGTFICEKCANDPEGFFKRAFSNTVKGAVIDDQIKQFKASFESQRKELDQLLNADNFSRIRTLLDDMLTAKLDRIPYVRNASFSQDYICLQDTRTRILEEIREWVEAEPPSDSKGASLFLLTGFAGSGKSAIAHTIAYRFSAGLDTTRGRLGSSFFFKALSDTEHEKRSAAALFSNISRELASQPENREWKKALGSIIDARFALINSPAPSARFDNLIRDPSQYLTVNFIDPVLIVIDSLDECKSAPVERKALLTILSSHLHEFPSNFRIFVTSRPEDELTNLKFPEGSHVERRDLETWQKDSIDQDLQRYYESRLGDLDESVTSSLDTRWPSRSWVAELIQRSEGLFQWAFTMCRELVAPGQVPVKFLNDVIQSKSGLGAMDKLYEEVLRDKFGSDPVQTKGVCSVLGFILCVRTPLPVSSLIALGETPDTAGSTQSVVRHLGSVLAGVSTDSELTSPIHAYHTSFLDFLFREGRSNLYHIDRLVQDKAIVEACLRVLTSEKLRFNICDIKSSHLSLDSSQVEAVANWLQRCGLGHLIYASQFWSVHLAQTAFDADLAALLHTFIRRKFLFWLELLAGIGQVHGAGNALKSMVSWAQHVRRYPRLRAFACPIRKRRGKIRQQLRGYHRSKPSAHLPLCTPFRSHHKPDIETILASIRRHDTSS
ncbi:hypothetical protein SISSUDRAFT_174394 [Sistotremastrum suecicum HHB10207 ss-3]|uniref:NACHT domain-containing protein n=1 Tax=Sistotremastrum suecicum HHB10207 ss-3 TaxID=1314776 RepID=A0A166AIW3_9AGAM|nr:hypothetical protein SISSUDRAFT_174394 [Sistotremastrum suecicum HHB10207 ss-3]